MTTVAEPIPPVAPVTRQKSKPLLPLRGVCSLVNEDENRVLELIKSGEIAWSFDVSLARRRPRRKYLRILPAAVADYLKGQPCRLKWPDVFALLLPDAPTIRAHEVSRLLNISGDQV